MLQSLFSILQTIQKLLLCMYFYLVFEKHSSSNMFCTAEETFKIQGNILLVEIGKWYQRETNHQKEKLESSILGANSQFAFSWPACGSGTKFVDQFFGQSICLWQGFQISVVIVSARRKKIIGSTNICTSQCCESIKKRGRKFVGKAGYLFERRKNVSVQ